MKSRRSLELLDERIAAAVGAPHVSGEGGRISVRPGSAAEIADVLRIAAEVGAPVGLFGPSAAGVALDLSRMRNVLDLDETSLLCSVQSGLGVEELEALLAERGLTLGPLPPTSRRRTIGALLAAPRPSEAGPRAGRFTAQCVGVAGLLPDGTVVSTRIAPRKATGPDLMQVLLGGRGTLGLITAATLRVFRRGEAQHQVSFRFKTVEDALRAARALVVRGGRPVELAVLASPARLSVQTDGTPAHAEAERKLAERIAAEHRGEPTPHLPPVVWTRAPHERFVAMETIEAAIPTTDAAGDGRVVGWHAQGAAVVDPLRAPDPPGEPTSFYGALKRRLDPDRRFPLWPGT